MLTVTFDKGLGRNFSYISTMWYWNSSCVIFNFLVFFFVLMCWETTTHAMYKYTMMFPNFIKDSFVYSYAARNEKVWISHQPAADIGDNTASSPCTPGAFLQVAASKTDRLGAWFFDISWPFFYCGVLWILSKCASKYNLEFSSTFRL